MKWFPLPMLLLITAMTSCGDGESETVQTGLPGGGAESNGQAGGEPVEPSAAEAAGRGDAEPDTAGGGSLRDRVEVTPAPPQIDDPFYSTAVTLEERMANVEKALEVAGKDGPVKIDIHDLGGWEFDERKEQPFPEYVRKLEGRTVILRGFMMPDIDFEHIRSFHLVRSLWGCCFGAPPRINELVRVVLANEKGMDYTYNTLEISGVFRTKFEMIDGMIEDVYRIDNATYVERGYEDPQAPTDFDASTGFDGIAPSGASEY